MKKVVILTGAGMSVESGLKTFRDADGLWENYPVAQVATHEGWLNDPALVTKFYNMLRKKTLNAKPNEGHQLVAALQNYYDVEVVTQNVDNLHEVAGSKKVVHLHGELMKVCSSIDPYDPRYIQELTRENPEVTPGTKAGDGSLLRPHIVFFPSYRVLQRGGADDRGGHRQMLASRHLHHHWHLAGGLSGCRTGEIRAQARTDLPHRPRRCEGA